MDTQRFSAELEMRGQRGLVVVPFDPAQVWPGREAWYVAGTVAGYSVRGVVEPLAGDWVLPLGPAWRRDNPLPEGKFEVELYLEGHLVETVAPDIAQALRACEAAAWQFHSQAPFYRNNLIRWIESAKRAGTRAARIAQGVELLREGGRM